MTPVDYFRQSRLIPNQRVRNLPPPKPDLAFARCPEPTFGRGEACQNMSIGRKLRLIWWRKRMWVESTFALTVYEPWEKVVVLTIFTILCTAIMVLLVKYLPKQLVVIHQRSLYYLWGAEDMTRSGSAALI